MSAEVAACVICDEGTLELFAHLAQVPIDCSALWTDRAQAIAAPRGDLALGACAGCGMIRNTAFDPELLDYDSRYDNSLYFSPSFRSFARELASDLIDRYELRGGTVIEIGCGKGEFLELLVELGAGQGVGYDPSYVPNTAAATNPSLRFVAEYYRGQESDADLICSRHVLEHIPEPRQMMRQLRQRLPADDTVLYFEVPDAASVLNGDGMWDLVYPHCSYFAAPSLRRLFEGAGFEVMRTRRLFGDQFLAIEARPRMGEATASRGAGGAGQPSELAALARQTAAFAERLRSCVDHWRGYLAEARRKGRAVALWGAGAKAVTFLSAVEAGEELGAVVDINPRKQGGYIPGTGHAVNGPEFLREIEPATVLIMNPLYRNEIQTQVQALGLGAEVVAV